MRIVTTNRRTRLYLNESSFTHTYIKLPSFRSLYFPGWSRPKSQSDNEQEDNNMKGSENELEPIIIDRGPFFDKAASKNVTALVGKTAYLNCRVRNLGNRTVGNFSDLFSVYFSVSFLSSKKSFLIYDVICI